MDTFLAPPTITAGVVSLLLLWCLKVVLGLTRLHHDAGAIEEWLWLHTEDEPGDSHRSVTEIAYCLQLSEDRVKRAVNYSRVIYRSARRVELVSVWRHEPAQPGEEQHVPGGARPLGAIVGISEGVGGR